LGEPETNGCAERWIRTLKEQCLWTNLYDSVDELCQAVAGFVATYNSQWLIGRLGHRTPNEAYQDATTTARPRDQIDVEAVQPTGRCSRPVGALRR
jgi:transposase InsO family protein